MSVKTAVVATRKARDYMRKLCIHWSQKFDVSYDDVTGRIQFSEGQYTVLTVSAEALQVEVFSEDASQLEHLCGIVAAHIERYAQKEALVFSWQ